MALERIKRVGCRFILMMINWPYFTQGEALSASKLRRLVKCCQDLERLSMSCRLQPGVGYTFNRGPGGASLAIPRSRGGKGGGLALPFACSIVKKAVDGGEEKEWVQIAKNGGVMLDVMGNPYDIIWGDGDVVLIDGVSTEGKFSVCLGWIYTADYDESELRTIKFNAVNFSDGGDLKTDEALKPVITAIKGEEGLGDSQVVLAVGEAKEAKGGVTMEITEQLVFSSLRAYWLPGYVDEEVGALGQYADVSIGMYQTPKQG